MCWASQNEKLAALQLRLEEVTAMHQQATDENESLRVRHLSIILMLGTQTVAVSLLAF